MAWRWSWPFSLAALAGLACIDIEEIRPPGAVPEPMRLGAACTTSADCVEGKCVDNVCCEVEEGKDTCPQCHACGPKGRCVPVPAGSRDPRLWCEFLAEEPSSCGRSATCDGKGGCAYHARGTICDAGTCIDGVVVNAHTCDGRGQCVPGATIVCGPFACDSRLCKETCASDADCLGVSCVSGSCGKRWNGARCESGDVCASGFCADGVCCNEACAGPCTNCSQQGSEGTCAYVAMGVVDPRGECPEESPMSCGFAGTCDGIGGCLRHKRDVVCGRACTTGGVSLRTYHCDGLGGKCTSSTPEIAVCPTNTCVASEAKCR